MFKFSARSLKNLDGVHPDLRRIAFANLDVSTVDFIVIEGVRTSERQHQMFTEGKSQLDDPPQPGKLKGRHVTGHAIDFCAWKDGKASFAPDLLKEVADGFKICATHMGIPVVWGGSWATFPDSDHLELDRTAYPDDAAPLIA